MMSHCTKGASPRSVKQSSRLVISYCLFDAVDKQICCRMEAASDYQCTRNACYSNANSIITHTTNSVSQQQQQQQQYTCKCKPGPQSIIWEQKGLLF